MTTSFYYDYDRHLRGKFTTLKMINGVLHKRCCTCHQYFPATTKFFYKVTSVSHGLNSACKQCSREGKKLKDSQQKKEHRDNKEAVKRRQKIQHEVGSELAALMGYKRESPSELSAVPGDRRRRAQALLKLPSVQDTGGG